MANRRRLDARRGAVNPLATAPLCVDEQYYHALAQPHLRQGPARRARDVIALAGPPLVAALGLCIVVSLALTRPAQVQRAWLLAPLQARFAGAPSTLAFALVAATPLLVALAMASLWARLDLSREQGVRAALDAKLRVARGYRRYLTGLATLTEPLTWIQRATQSGQLPDPSGPAEPHSVEQAGEAPGCAVLVALSLRHDPRCDEPRRAHVSESGEASAWGEQGAAQDSRPISRYGWEVSVQAARDELGQTKTVDSVTQALARARSGAILLCGAEGAGKTTLMRYVAHTQALAQLQRTRPGGRIPLYADLAWLESDWPAEGDFSTEQALTALAQRIGGVEAEVARALARAMTQAPALLLFDELDTLPGERRERFVSALATTLTSRRRLRLKSGSVCDGAGDRWSAQVVISSRSYVAPLGAGPASARFERWTLEPLAYPMGRLALARGAIQQWRATVASATQLDSHGSVQSAEDAAETMLRVLATPATEAWLTQPLSLTLAAIAGIGANTANTTNDASAARPCRTRGDLYATATWALLCARLPDWDDDERRAVQRLAEDLALWLSINQRRSFRPGAAEIDERLLRTPEARIALARAAATSPSQFIATMSGLCETGPGDLACFSLTSLHSLLAGSSLARLLRHEWSSPVAPDAFALWVRRSDSEGRSGTALAWARRASARWGDTLQFMCGALCAPATPGSGEPRSDLAVAWLRALLAQDDDLAESGLPLAASSLPQLRGADASLATDIAARLGQRLTEGAPEPTRAALETLHRASAAMMADPAGRQALLDHLRAALLGDGEQAARQAARTLGALGQAGVCLASDLIDLLRSTIWTPRAAVAQAIGALGPACGAEAIPALIAAQSDQTLAVRVAATQALGAVAREPDGSVIRALLARLSDHEDEVRAAAALALGKTGASAQQVAESLLQAMSDPETRVQIAAAYALGADVTGAGQIPALVESLAAIGWSERAAAALALGALGPAAEAALPALLELSRTDTIIVRMTATSALARIGPSRAECVAALIERLGDEATETRRAAADALAQMDVALPEIQTQAWPALLHALRDPRGSVRNAAADALDALDAMSDPQTNMATFALLDDPRGYVRAAAARALAALGTADARALPARITDLASMRDEAQLVAIDELGMLGPAARAATPALQRLLDDPRGDVRLAALRAILRVAPARVAASLCLKRASDGEARVRLEALTALSALGQRGDRRLIETLRQRLLEDADGDVRAAAAAALGRLSPSAASALPTLLAALGDRDYATQRAAALAIGALRPSLPDGVSRLTERLSDPTPGARGAVALALGALGPQAAPSVTPELLKLLRDEVADVRAGAAEALGLLGPQVDDAARRALLQRLNDADTETRAAATLALGRVGAGDGPEQLEHLAEALLARAQDRRYLVRSAAVEALAALGPVAVRAALPRLLEMLRDTHPSVRQATLAALATLDAAGQADALPALRRSLDATDADERAAAARALAGLGSALDTSDRESLIRLLGAADEAVRAAAAQAIGALSATLFARSAPPAALGALLADPDWRPRAAATEALGRFGARAGESMRTALWAALADSDETTRQAAALALARIDATGATALLGELLAIIKSRRAADTLAPIGQRRELEAYAALERPSWPVVERVAQWLEPGTHWSVMLASCALIARWHIAPQAALRRLLSLSERAPSLAIRQAARVALRSTLDDSPDFDLTLASEHSDAGRYQRNGDASEPQPASARLADVAPPIVAPPIIASPAVAPQVAHPAIDASRLSDTRAGRDLVLRHGGDAGKSA